jgi:hypothetical protein
MLGRAGQACQPERDVVHVHALFVHVHAADTAVPKELCRLRNTTFRRKNMVPICHSITARRTAI